MAEKTRVRHAVASDESTGNRGELHQHAGGTHTPLTADWRHRSR
jgi:hypothetical protein